MSLVSVIIPTYNRARFLKVAIESALAQTHKDLEIIVVDDGSTDNTAELLRPYFLKITYIRQNSAGPAAARNRALGIARGDYIAFLDSDDIWHPEKIEHQLEAFMQNPAIGACHTNADLIDENENIVAILAEDEGYIQSGMVLKAILMWRCRIFLSSLMVTRECLRQAGDFDVSLRTGEDWHFIVRCARRYPFGYLTEKLLLRRAHPASLTSNAYASDENNTTFLSLRKALDILPEIDGPTRRRAFEIRYYHYGYINFRRRNYPLARRFFRLALGCSASNLHTYAFMLLSLFPPLAEILFPDKLPEGARP